MKGSPRELDEGRVKAAIESKASASKTARDRLCACGKIHWRPDLLDRCLSCELAAREAYALAAELERTISAAIAAAIGPAEVVRTAGRFIKGAAVLGTTAEGNALVDDLLGAP